jgi:hypothetical protein
MPEIEVSREAMGPSAASPLDTLPKLLLDRAERYGVRPAMREKDLGIWQTWTWRQVRDEVRALAGGLAALGLRRGDRVAVVGDNRPRLYWAIAATQCLGGVPVPMYQDSVAAELQYVLEHAEARFVVAEDQEQVDKILEVRARCPRVEAVIYDDPRGLRNYDQPLLHRYEDVQSLGRRWEREHPDAFAREVAAGTGSEVAIILYTRENARAVRQDVERVYAYFPRLAERRASTAGYVSGGEQQMLAIGRALMARPKLMLLDEPSMGLAPLLVQEIFEIVERLNREEKVSILLAEQNAARALSVVRYGYVMENGRVVLDGEAEKLRSNEDVKEFYLGLSGVGQRRSFRHVKHYKRRKRWLS